MNLEGEIRDIQLVERLIELWRERFTGAIRFENDGVIKIIYFKEGDILSASTNDRADSVDEILMRAGKVSKEHVKQALVKRKESETLGDALLHLGFITRKELSWARRIQVINVVRSVSAWEGGTYTMVADYLPKREEGTMFPLPQLVVEMIVTESDRGTFERLLDSGAAVFEKVPGEEDTFRSLGLNEDAEAVMEQVNGERSATEVAAASRQETFNAFKLLHALTLLGILRRSAPADAAAGFESAGVADAAEVWTHPSPQFDLDDEPPPASLRAEELNDVPPVAPVGHATPAAEPPRATAGWDAPPRGASPLVAPAPEPPAEPAEEPRWGFDEGQIEAARRPSAVAAVPAPRAERKSPRTADGTMSRRAPVLTAPAAKRSPSRYGLVVALITVFIIGAAAYFGYAWWTSRATAAPSLPEQLVDSTPASDQSAAVAEASVPAEAATTPATSPAVVETAPPPAPLATPVQPAGAAVRVASSGAERARYDAMAREFAASPAGSFTVQFAIVCDPSNVTKALRSSAAADVWFIPITLKERSCYRMFWGRFASREEAERALARIPGEFRESKPAVVTIPR